MPKENEKNFVKVKQEPKDIYGPIHTFPKFTQYKTNITRN